MNSRKVNFSKSPEKTTRPWLENVAQSMCFAVKTVNWDAVEKWPDMGVPEELRQCAIQMVEAEHMQFATPGPGTIRQPNDARLEAEDSDVSDELKEEADEPNCHNCSAAQPDA